MTVDRQRRSTHPHNDQSAWVLRLYLRVKLDNRLRCPLLLPLDMRIRQAQGVAQVQLRHKAPSTGFVHAEKSRPPVLLDIVGDGLRRVQRLRA